VKRRDKRKNMENGEGRKGVWRREGCKLQIKELRI